LNRFGWYGIVGRIGSWRAVAAALHNCSVVWPVSVVAKMLRRRQDGPRIRSDRVSGAVGLAAGTAGHVHLATRSASRATRLPALPGVMAAARPRARFRVVAQLRQGNKAAGQILETCGSVFGSLHGAADHQSGVLSISSLAHLRPSMACAPEANPGQ
jgi:hypothetical protein